MTQLIPFNDEDKRLAALLESTDLSVGGQEHITQEDIGMPPRLRLSQPNRPIDDVPVGAFTNTLTGEVFDETNPLEIIVVSFLTKTRVKWPAKFDADNEPECKSDNGNAPSGGTAPESGPCVICPMAQFLNGEAPACNLQYNFLVWVVNSNDMALLTLQSTAVRTAKQLIQLAKTGGLRRTVLVGTVFRKESKGSWYVPTVRRGNEANLETLLQLAELRDEWANLVVTADIGEVTGAAAATAAAASPVIEDDLDSIPF